MEKISEHISDLVDTSYKLSMATAAEKASNAASSGASLLIPAVLAIFGLLFVGMGAAIWIGDALNNTKLGYFIIGGAFFIATAILAAIRKSIVIPAIRNSIVRKMYE